MLRAGFFAKFVNYNPILGAGFADGFKIRRESAEDSPMFLQVIYVDTSPDFWSVDRHLSDLLKNSAIVSGRALLIANIGLHYRGPGFDLVLESLIKTLLSHSQYHDVFFREASAQHFDTKTGEFSFTGNHPALDRANSLIEKDHLYREKVSSISLLAEKLGFVKPRNLTDIFVIDPNNYADVKYDCKSISSVEAAHEQFQVHVAPAHTALQAFDINTTIDLVHFFRISASRFDHHVVSLGDCTHFCFGPMIWLPVYNQIAVRLKEKIKIREKKSKKLLR